MSRRTDDPIVEQAPSNPSRRDRSNDGWDVKRGEPSVGRPVLGPRGKERCFVQEWAMPATHIASPTRSPAIIDANVTTQTRVSAGGDRPLAKCSSQRAGPAL